MLLTVDGGEHTYPGVADDAGRAGPDSRSCWGPVITCATWLSLTEMHPRHGAG